MTDDADIQSNLQMKPWEMEIIMLFNNFAGMVGFRKSVGTIYGYMFCKEEPTHLEQIMQHLGMSKGTVSQGLNFLKKTGAIRQIFVPGDRKEYFTPELSLKYLVRGFIRDQVEPQLQSGEERIKHLDTLIKEHSAEVDNTIKDRVKSLKNWQRQAKVLIPVLQKFLETTSKS